jgi:hypothetical protein
MVRNISLVWHPKRRLLFFGSLIVALTILLWLISLANTQVPAFHHLPVQMKAPALELTLLGAVAEQVQFAEAEQFLEATCHASGFSFSLSPETAPHALSLNFSLPMPTGLELAGSYSLAPGSGDLTIYLPASAETPSARVFEAQAELLQVSDNRQGNFTARFRDGTGTSLVAIGRWNCP